MFSQMCEAVAVCHDAGVSHRDIKPENFICCDSIELETAAEGDLDFGPQAKRKVVVKLTDFGLATTDEESGDVECGSKPYMSYECRNNLGPTYYPPAADVWSLGIVLINMLFHRNPWKDPTEGDPNFDNFLRDPTSFFLNKFTGIGREVAAYLACHVLCVEVEDRVSARDLGQWIKTLPEMIGGRKAARELKMAKIDTRVNGSDKGLFAKSPIQHPSEQSRKASASALTSSAPTLSNLPPANLLSHQSSVQPTPELLGETDLDPEASRSPTTVDEQPTPADTDTMSSPDAIEPGSDQPEQSPDGDAADADARSLSQHRRRKRGVRKGKAAQAALAAASNGDNLSKEDRDAMLKELAAASQSLARHLSKTSRPTSEFDTSDTVDFPPLGTTPSQAAAAKKSKWKDMMKMSSGNPELAALARRVAERDGQSGGNWSAPAEMQHSAGKRILSGSVRPSFKHTATMSSSEVSSSISTFDPASTSATSLSGGADEEDWRAKAADARREREEKDRARKAQAAAKALTAGLDPMGAFGANRPLGQGHPGHLRTGAMRSSSHGQTQSHVQGQPSHRLHLHTIDDEESKAEPEPPTKPTKIERWDKDQYRSDRHNVQEASVSVETAVSSRTSYTHSSMESSTATIKPLPVDQSPPTTMHMNKPKLKGQIQSLAKMLSGLKTKGKE